MTTKYDLASRLVQREVLECAYQLVSALLEASQSSHVDSINLYADELQNLAGNYDYEAAAEAFIRDDADEYDLEAIVETYGDWEELLKEIGFVQEELDEAYNKLDAEVDEAWRIYIDNEDTDAEHELKEVHDRLEHRRDALPQDLDDWLKQNEGKNAELRDKVFKLVDEKGYDDDFKDICENHGLDPDWNETYEHWIVSDWLGRKLKEKGQTVEGVLGLTIWGRGCTGQAIALDYVIQQIAVELWGGEVTETSCADAF